MRDVVCVLLGISSVSSAASPQELPSHIEEGLESGRLSPDAYVRLITSCAATYEIAALTHGASSQYAEAERMKDLADAARRAASYLLERDVVSRGGHITPEQQLRIAVHIEARIEEMMEQTRRLAADATADYQTNFLARVKACDESGDLRSLSAAAERATSGR